MARSTTLLPCTTFTMFRACSGLVLLCGAWDTLLSGLSSAMADNQVCLKTSYVLNIGSKLLIRLYLTYANVGKRLYCIFLLADTLTSVILRMHNLFFKTVRQTAKSVWKTTSKMRRCTFPFAAILELRYQNVLI